VILLQPRNAEAHVYRGIARVYQRKEKEADADFQEAFQIDPSLKKNVQPLIEEAKAQINSEPAK
jgi:hypothetical protein